MKEANARLVNKTSSDQASNSNIRHSDLRLLETVKEVESEKTRSQSNDSFCSTPSSYCDYNKKGFRNGSDRIKSKVESDDDDDNLDEYGISLLVEKDKDMNEDSKDEEEESVKKSARVSKSGEKDRERGHGRDQKDEKDCDRDTDKDGRDGSTDKDRDNERDDKDDKDEKDPADDEGQYSGLEKFFVKPASEFIVDFFDAFSNIDDGGVALMMEYMDGTYDTYLRYVLTTHIGLFPGCFISSSVN